MATASCSFTAGCRTEGNLCQSTRKNFSILVIAEVTLFQSRLSCPDLLRVWVYGLRPIPTFVQQCPGLSKHLAFPIRTFTPRSLSAVPPPCAPLPAPGSTLVALRIQASPLPTSMMYIGHIILDLFPPPAAHSRYFVLACSTRSTASAPPMPVAGPTAISLANIKDVGIGTRPLLDARSGPSSCSWLS